MRKYMLGAVGALMAAMFAVAGVATNPANATVRWGPAATHSDFAGHGQLQITYRIDMNHSVGFYVESLRVCSDNDGLFFQGIDGKGASIWNETGDIKFSTNNTDLNPGQCRAWDLEIGMPNADTLRAGWLFTEINVPGSDTNRCARLTIHHLDWSSGGC